MKKVFVILMMLVAFGIGAQTVSGTIENVYATKNYHINLDAPTIKDYVNVRFTSLDKLDAAVKGMIAQGWVPLGSISVVFDTRAYGNVFYIQTMVKY